jgi:starch synthase
MRIVQTVFGVFHHFDLARELDRRGHLERIYSTFPWQRLQREGLPHNRVETFPWLHLAELLAGRAGAKSGLNLRWLADELGYRNALAFDRWTERKVQRLLEGGVSIDALIGISGSSLRTGTLVQEAGGIFLCDRGSTHQRYQEYVIAEEFTRWGVQMSPSDERDTLREEAIYAAADAITVPSSMAARSFVGMGVPAEKLHVIPYGVRLDAFRPAPDAAAGPPEDTFTVLFAGAVGLRKGIPYLLQAFAQVRHPKKRLVLAGAIQQDLRGCLPRLPREHVEFSGARDRNSVVALMQSSHVLVLPSIEDGFGLVVPEAMACGCPVICADSAGAADMVTPGVNGFVFPSRNVAALAAALQDLADDPELRRRVRRAAIESTARIGGWEQYGDRWEALLKHLTTATN